MRKVLLRCLVACGVSFCAASPVVAGTCRFTERSGKVTIQGASVSWAYGRKWIYWSDGGRTDYVHVGGSGYRDEGGNYWDLYRHVGQELQMRRSDGAFMNCY